MPTIHTHIGLLRAVNVAGHNSVRMPELCAMAAAAGFYEPRTLLASGNLVVGSKERDPERVAAILEREAAARLGLQTRFFARSAAEWDEIVTNNPFPGEAKSDPGHLLVLVLSSAPARAAAAALDAAIVGREKVRVVGRTAYAVYPDGAGRSKLTSALIERKLGVQFTGRNWNTVLKLAAAAAVGGRGEERGRG